MTKVSVIIPTYNRSQMVTRAVSSVLFQTFKDFEVIVVDDGSTDDTLDRLGQFDRHIVLHRHAANLGVSAARNSGIQVARSPLIAFLDSDDYWLPGKLAAQVEFFKQTPDAVACQTEEIWIRRGRRANPRNKHLKPSGDIFLPSLKLCLVSPSAVMVKASLLRNVGLFDEDLPACEDYDLWLRISCHYPIDLLDQYLVVKEGGHADQLSLRYNGMDRFRIRAMLKLIESGRLNDSQVEATLKELSIKCRIYGEGCLRRNKTEEGNYYLSLCEKAMKKGFPAPGLKAGPIPLGE